MEVSSIIRSASYKVQAPDTVVSHTSNETIIPMHAARVPSMQHFLKGCNFSNCNETSTGSSVQYLLRKAKANMHHHGY